MSITKRLQFPYGGIIRKKDELKKIIEAMKGNYQLELLKLIN